MSVVLTAMAPILACATGAPGPGQATAPAVKEKIASYLRERFSVTDSTSMIVGALRPSIYAGFDKTTVTVQNGKQKASQDFYVSKDGQYLVQGNIYSLNVDPRKEVEKLIRTEDEPSTGPPGAPVTIVEYADLECPICAQVHQML
ncbi:MAG: thioredoxin domain-containing protein [Terriglobia bacterium]